MFAIDQTRFGKPDKLFDEIIQALAAIGDDGEHELLFRTEMGVLECVDVQDELAESEGFAAQSYAGFEALEPAS